MSGPQLRQSKLHEPLGLFRPNEGMRACFLVLVFVWFLLRSLGCKSSLRTKRIVSLGPLWEGGLGPTLPASCVSPVRFMSVGAACEIHLRSYMSLKWEFKCAVIESPALFYCRLVWNSCALSFVVRVIMSIFHTRAYQYDG